MKNNHEALSDDALQRPAEAGKITMRRKVQDSGQNGKEVGKLGGITVVGRWQNGIWW